MSEVLERLRASRRRDVELASGLKVTLRRPSMRDCLIAGDIPLPVLSKMEAQAGGVGVEMTADELRHMARVQDEFVRRSVVLIDQEDVDLSEVADLSDVFSDDERLEILAYAQRQDAEGNG